MVVKTHELLTAVREFNRVCALDLISKEKHHTFSRIIIVNALKHGLGKKKVQRENQFVYIADVCDKYVSPCLVFSNR